VAPTLSDRAKKRRRVVKAAFSVPAVLTLPHGGEAAAASLTCDVKSNALAATTPPAGVTATTDTWMRYRLPKYKINQTGGQVYGILLDDQYYRIDSDGSATPITPAGNGNSNTELVANQYYYALVDYSTYSTTPNITAFVYPAKSPVASPIAGASCWNSLLVGSALDSNVVN
jgi:hypothetical protein